MKNKSFTRLFVVIWSVLSSVSLIGCSEEGGQINDELITLQEYSQLDRGMTYEGVVKIIGGEGKSMSEKGEGTTEQTLNYVWDGAAPNSFVSVSF
ncbi:hypothetical protein [Halobacillus hunanensis]|uniref:hypothetical protein n=1 Tax=Halobacillus hunanensis TaxID=578214 RepID=UPI0009A72493|nr:hypothetical protein [Halobacillus hunanensis]